MRVYNLMEAPLNYRGREIPPNGGFLEYPDIGFIPDRDRRLAELKVLAFGELPAWWHAKQAAKASQKAPETPKTEAPPKVLKLALSDEVKVEDKVETSTFVEKPLSRKLR